MVKNKKEEKIERKGRLKIIKEQIKKPKKVIVLDTIEQR